MQLRKRHAAALEPAVQHLIDASKCLAVNFKGDVIHPRAVVIIQLHAAQFLQLRVRANHPHRTAVALPHRHSRRPETITAQVPVWCLFDIFGKAAVLQVNWEPINMLVLIQHQRLLPLNVKEPAGDGPVHDALFATRVERVFVTNVLNLPHHALFFQVFGDEFIIFPYLQAFVIAIGVVTVIVDHMEGRDAISFTKLKVILTVSRRNVHNASTRLVRDKIRCINGMDFVILWPGRAGIERLVFLTHQFAPWESAQHFIIKRPVLFILQSALQRFLSDD